MLRRYGRLLADMEGMKRMLIWLLLSPFMVFSQSDTLIGGMGEKFTVRTVAKDLSDPWELIYGPDGFLWVTEARGYRVCRINTRTGGKHVLLDISNRKNFPRYDLIPDKQDGGKPWPQSGLMGMALHPKLLTGQPYVYIAYLYYFDGADKEGNGCLPGKQGCLFKTRLERYTYRKETDELTDPMTICETIPGSNDHNGGRLIIAPVNEQYYLFYSVGDMGAGQYDNAGRPNHAQDPAVYEGKVLRFNSEPDSDINSQEQWIPNDNPFNKPQQSAVWSIGHRNIQGLAYSTTNHKLYAVEHGPFSDDEVNLIEPGKNYGHPLVIGYNEGNYNQLAAGVNTDTTLPGKWHTTYPLIASEQENALAIGPAYRNPLTTLYPAAGRLLTALLHTIASGNTDNNQWLSEAPSGMTLYTSTAIPGWNNCLLLATLKGGKLIRLHLNNTGDSINSDTINYFRKQVRYRDVAVSADGWSIYLTTDSATRSSGPSGDKGVEYEQRGMILEFTYMGTATPQSRQAPAPLRETHPANVPQPVHRQPPALPDR